VTNTFDPDSHRVERDDGTDVVRYVYDGHNVLLQTDDASVTEAAYTLNPQPYGHVISRREPAAESLFHHFDGRHNTANLSDEVAAVAGEYQYDAFGKLLQGDPSATPHLYKGEVGYHHDADLDTGEGSYLAHHRVLSGGRFLSEDPAEDDLNTYRHVRNNPLNESDPSGLDGDPFRELGRLRNELEKLPPHVARKLVRRRIRSIVSGRPDTGNRGHEADINAFRKKAAEVQEQVRARREFDDKSLSEKAAIRGYHFFIKAALANYDRIISPEAQKRFGIDSPDLKREAELLDQTIGPRPVGDFGAENLDRLSDEPGPELRPRGQLCRYCGQGPDPRGDRPD
jgi:RHS repeat-associated protein